MADYKQDPEYAEFMAWKAQRAAEAKLPSKPPKLVRTSNKVKQSGFLLTVNSQLKGVRPMDATDQKYRPLLTQAINAVLDDLGPYIKHRQDGEGRWGKYAFDETKNSLVDGIEHSIHFEIGPRTGALHAHVPIKVTHRSNLQLDGQKIARTVNQLTGLPGVYVNLKGVAVKGEWGKMLEYARKNAAS